MPKDSIESEDRTGLSSVNADNQSRKIGAGTEFSDNSAESTYANNLQTQIASKSDTGSGEAEIEIKEGKKIPFSEMAQTSVSDWAAFTGRLKENGLENPDFVELCAEHAILKKTDPASAGGVFDKIIDHLGSVQSSSTKMKTKDNQDDTAANNFSLWSGAKSQAEDFAHNTGGISLEASVTGGIFDNLGSLGADWNKLSTLYAQSITGDLHIHQYRGVRGQSVFNKYEYPTIKASIDAGLINPYIHLYANRGLISSFSYGTPVYGKGADDRKEIGIMPGKAALTSFIQSPWEFGDAKEKEGGFWPDGKDGNKVEKTNDKGEKVTVLEGEEW